jgi:Outer membrane lipoprotein carrier protein LolA
MSGPALWSFVAMTDRFPVRGGSRHGAQRPAARSNNARAVLSLLTIALAALALAMPSRDSAAFSAEAKAALVKAPNASPRITLDSLLSRFRASPGLFARYREEKRIALLAEPLVSEGTVHYAPPRRIARHARTPSPSSVVFDGKTLRFGDETGQQQIDVRAAPVAQAFIESFVGVLAGDGAQLERAFVVELRAGDAAHPGERWDLSLVPRAPALLAILSEVRFAGDGPIVSQLRVREASGDEGVTTFFDVDPAHRYSAAEEARVFRVSGGNTN